MAAPSCDAHACRVDWYGGTVVCRVWPVRSLYVVFRSCRTHISRRTSESCLDMSVANRHPESHDREQARADSNDLIGIDVSVSAGSASVYGDVDPAFEARPVPVGSAGSRPFLGR